MCQNVKHLQKTTSNSTNKFKFSILLVVKHVKLDSHILDRSLGCDSFPFSVVIIEGIVYLESKIVQRGRG